MDLENFQHSYNDIKGHSLLSAGHFSIHHIWFLITSQFGMHVCFRDMRVIE